QRTPQRLRSAVAPREQPEELKHWFDVALKRLAEGRRERVGEHACELCGASEPIGDPGDRHSALGTAEELLERIEAAPGHGRERRRDLVDEADARILPERLDAVQHPRERGVRELRARLAERALAEL